MISSLLHLVGLRPRVYYTLTNFRGGGARPPWPPPQYANVHLCRNVVIATKQTKNLLFIAEVCFLYYFTGTMERKFVLESCLKSGFWGILEMYILLTDEMVEFEMPSDCKVWDLDTLRVCLSPLPGVRLNYKRQLDTLITLLRIRCPVSISTNSNRTSSC